MTHRPLFLLILLPLVATLQASHDESLGARFVDPQGADTTNCLDHHAPCRSLAYALSQALPGNTVRVGAGAYDLRLVDPESFLWGPIKARGGFGEATDWEVSDPAANPTIVSGLDERYRAVLAARGFRLVHKAGEGPGSSEPLQAAQLAAQACTNGFAAQFPCANVDYLAQIPLAQFSSRPTSAANVWGFVDRNDNREYAVVGLSNATAVIDVTDPVNPREVGSIPGNASIWREVKILQRFDTQSNRYRAYAYISTEAPGSGLQVIDLSGLPNSVALAGTLNDTATQHTLYVSNIDYSSNTALPGAEPFLYVAGSNVGNGRWRSYSLANPAVPAFAGEAPAGTGYMHDSTGLRISDSRVAQCAPGHDPCELLIDFNENAVEIWDVTSKSTPLRLSATPFASFRYVHSGWPSSDQRFVVVHDELDEIRGSVAQTNIYTLDLTDLRAPVLNVSWVGPNNSTDHNGYTKGNRYYVSHYRRGLVVFDATDPRRLREIGSFDTFLMSASNTAGTDGAWGVYPFLPSGTVLISDIDNGLFLLKDNTALLVGAVGTLGVASQAAQFAENAGNASVRVQRLGGSTGAVSVSYATRDGTALAGSDYTAASGTLNWADGDLADKTVTIALTNDASVEPDENFSLLLSAATGGAALGAATIVVTIANDDVAAPPPASGGGGGGAFDLLSLLLLAGVLRAATRRASCP